MGLLISIGFLIWCREKHRLPRVDSAHNEPHQEAAVQGQEASVPETDHPTETQCSGRPVISLPISNLNSAYDKVDSSSESIYNEAADYTEPYSSNPFQGWIRPIGPPPPPPPEAFAMVVRPVPKINKSTMTLESDYSMTKRLSKASSEFKSGYAASPETSLERKGAANTMTGARPKQNRAYNQSDQAFDEGPPHYELPPLPVRSTSLRRKNKRRRRIAGSTAASTAATVS